MSVKLHNGFYATVTARCSYFLRDLENGGGREGRGEGRKKGRFPAEILYKQFFGKASLTLNLSI